MPEIHIDWPALPVSRRALLKYALATGATLSLADLIAACGTAATSASTAKRVGHIVCAVSGAESSINPLETLGHSESYWAWDALTYVDPTQNGAVFPRLATSWRQLGDTTVEFKLRPNVRFSDGSLMTADDVKFSFDTTISEKLAVFSLLSTIAEVEVVDPHTVRITTTSPDPLLVRKVALQFIVPKAVYSRVGTNGFQQSPIGTGKYMITKYVPGQVIELQANPHSWAGQPVTPQVSYRMFSSVNALQNALEGGQVDVTFFTGGTGIVDQFSGSFQIQSAQVGGPRNLKLNTVKAPFNDRRVRLALNYAIDMATISKTVNKGFGVPLQGQLPTQQCFGYDPSIKAFGYDLGKAKSLLAQAGYGNGFETDIASAFTYHDVMVAIAGYLAKVGIKATVVDEDLPTFIKEFYYGSPHDMYMYGANFSPVYDADLSFRWMTAPLPPVVGHRAWVDPHWDQMLAEERVTVNTKTRLKELQQMSEYLHQQVPIVFLDSQAYVYVWSKKVHDFDPSTGFYFLIDKAYKTE